MAALLGAAPPLPWQNLGSEGKSGVWGAREGQYGRGIDLYRFPGVCRRLLVANCDRAVLCAHVTPSCALLRAAGSLSGAGGAAVEPSEASPGAVYTVRRRCVRARGGGPDRKFRFEKYFTEFLSGPIFVNTLLRHAQTRFYDDTRGSN